MKNRSENRKRKNIPLMNLSTHAAMQPLAADWPKLAAIGSRVVQWGCFFHFVWQFSLWIHPGILTLPHTHTPCFLYHSERLVDFYFSVTVRSPPAVDLILKLTCRTRSADGGRIKGDFFPSPTVAPAAAAGPQGVSLKMWNVVFWPGDCQSCASVRLLVPTETHKTNTRTVSFYCFIYWFQLAEADLAELLCKSNSNCIYHHNSDFMLLSIPGAPALVEVIR